MIDLCKDIPASKDTCIILLQAIHDRNKGVKWSISTETMADGSHIWETFKANGAPVFEIQRICGKRTVTDLRK
jgi:hypothetical protein